MTTVVPPPHDEVREGRPGRARQRRPRFRLPRLGLPLRRREPRLGLPARETTMLVVRAHARARADVAAGSFDQWSFDDDRLLPYLYSLRAACDHRVQAARTSILQAVRSERDRYEHRLADAQVLERRLAFLQQQHDEATYLSRRTLARMDRLATREARRREILRFRPWAGRHPLNGPDGDARRAATEHLGIVPETETVPFEGAQAPPVRRLARVLTLGFLALIDLPITYLVFSFFHGQDAQGRILTAIFAVPVAFVMVMLPHLVGRIVRHRHATGRERIALVCCALLLAPWGFMAYQLGLLRSKVLLVPSIDPETGLPAVNPLTKLPYTTLADQLHTSAFTINIMFIGLMLITGGIGFLLGLAHEHPLQRAYRRCRKELRKIERRLGRIRTRNEAPDPAADAVTAARIADSQRTIRAAYASAEHAYLDGITQAMGDPAVTDAVSRMADRVATVREQTAT